MVQPREPDKPVVVYHRHHLQRCCVPKDPIDPSARRDIQRIGRNVASLRAWRKIGQEDLSHVSGVSVRHIQRIEAGDGDPAASFYIRLARALNVPLFWVFTDDWPRFAEEQVGGGEASVNPSHGHPDGR
jgi:DNA-binding XRE family transcriptional regulator